MSDFKVTLSGGLSVGSSAEISFPYTPTVSFGNTSSYSDYDLVHTNYSINAFSNSRPNNISIAAPFYNQTIDEAQQTSKIIRYLRTNMKMSFGTANGTGAPPPVLKLNAYGNNLRDVPVVIISFDTSFSPEPDYVSDGNGSYLPTDMTINIGLLPQYSATIQSNFDLNTFASGDGYKQGFI